jgi:hypothetical protein
LTQQENLRDVVLFPLMKPFSSPRGSGNDIEENNKK